VNRRPGVAKSGDTARRSACATAADFGQDFFIFKIIKGALPTAIRSRPASVAFAPQRIHGASAALADVYHSNTIPAVPWLPVL
jgi:hypothetical protein